MSNEHRKPDEESTMAWRNVAVGWLFHGIDTSGLTARSGVSRVDAMLRIKRVLRAPGPWRERVDRAAEVAGASFRSAP